GPGANVRRALRGDRQSPPRVGPRRPGSHQRAPAGRSDLVRCPGRSVPRQPVRSGTPDADPRVAHRPRRRLRERRAVEAPLVLPDRMYTNTMSSLTAGRIRYGLLVGLDGMVMDDGVAMRLADDRYLVTTTTGGAAKVLDWFEEWLQTEWPDLRVYCTSVTEQWGVVAVGGPRARDVVTRIGIDVGLPPGAFPSKTWRDG